MYRNLSKKVKNNKGFTLIELIVVIAIIAILALILVPRFVGFQDRAQSAADRATARTIHSAVSVMIAEGDITVSDDTAQASFTVGDNTSVGSVTNIDQDATTIQTGLQELIGTDVDRDDAAGVFTVRIAVGGGVTVN